MPGCAIIRKKTFRQFKFCHNQCKYFQYNSEGNDGKILENKEKQQNIISPGSISNNHANDIIYDLAVVGCGPSGALAASLAAESGLSTVILESKKHPRPKICGGFLSARSIALLPKDFNLSSLPSEAVYQVATSKRRKPYTYNSKTRLGLVVEREKFDQLIAEYACSKGARLIEEEPLQEISKISGSDYKSDSYYLLKTGKNADNTIKARCLIGADGAMGKTALLAGLRKPGKGLKGWGMSRVIKTKSKVAETGTSKFYPLPSLGGMSWSFSGPDWTNQGVGGLFSKSLMLKAYRKIFHNNINTSNPLFWPLPFLGPLQKSASGNLLLIGDAAGLVEPFSGEGLYNSFKSAILAVQAVKLGKKENTAAEKTYNYLFKKNFRKHFCACLGGALLLYARSLIHPSSLPHSIALLMENKQWFNHDIDSSNIYRDDPVFNDIVDR